jgi:ankyrin repeat protein
MAEDGAPGIAAAGAEPVSHVAAPAQADAESSPAIHSYDYSLWDWDSRVYNATPEPPVPPPKEAEVEAPAVAPAAAPAATEPTEPCVEDASPPAFTPELRRSVVAGMVAPIEDWLVSGGDANARDSKGRTLLMIAASFSNADVVRVALEHGADPELKQHQGVTALMFASMAGHNGIVHLLLAGNANADARDSRGLTAHDYASLKGHYFISCLLLQHSVRHSHPTSSSNEDTSRGSKAEDSLLSQSTTRPHDEMHPWPGGEHPELGESPSAAAADSPTAVVSPLPAPGDEQKPSPSGEAGGVAPPDATPPRPRLPAKMLEAAQKADTASIRAYLDGGGDVNAVDDELLGTMLMCAASSGHDDLAAMLLDAGASPDIRDGNGCTALATACFSQQPGMVRLLLQAGAELNNQDLLGLTALMVSALSGATSIIRLLLAAGAATDLRDMAGRTAYDYAQINGHLAARKLLRAHRLGRATRPRPEAPVPDMTVEQEERANAMMQELLAEEAAKAAAATAKADRSARKLHKARRGRKDRRSPATPAAGSQAVDRDSVNHETFDRDPGAAKQDSVGGLARAPLGLPRRRVSSQPPNRVVDYSVYSGAEDSTHGSISDWTNDSTHPSLPSTSRSSTWRSGHGLAPGRHARFQVPIATTSARGGAFGGHIGHCTQLWTGYDSTASTHDTSHVTWDDPDRDDPDLDPYEPDFSIASLASSVACSALEDRSVGGEEIPSMLFCPLTGEMMRDPVSTVDGQVQLLPQHCMYDTHTHTSFTPSFPRQVRDRPLASSTLLPMCMTPPLPPFLSPGMVCDRRHPNTFMYDTPPPPPRRYSTGTPSPPGSRRTTRRHSPASRCR